MDNTRDQNQGSGPGPGPGPGSVSVSGSCSGSCSGSGSNSSAVTPDCMGGSISTAPIPHSLSTILPIKRRNRSKKACLTCGQRKVKCDVTTKNYPRERCSNCEEYGIECIVPQRKRRKTKKEVEAVRREIQEQLNRQKQLQHEIKLQNQLNTSSNFAVGPFTELKGDEIIVDPTVYLRKAIDQTKLSRILKHHSSNVLLRLATPFYLEKRIFTARDLITDECLTTLKLTGCFILPSYKTCERYIDTYFNTYHILIPVLSVSVFKEEFKDLRNPSSLLLLLCILYIGCKVSAKTPEDLRNVRILYEKAKLVLHANLEINGVYLSLAYIHLCAPPCNHPSIQNIESYLKSAVSVAMSFGMHKNVENVDYLTIEEKRMYKRLFSVLLVKDRAYALTFSKNYNILMSDCTVKPLTYEDLDDTGAPNQQITFQYFKEATAFQIVTDKITRLQKNANMAAISGRPFSKYILQAEVVMKDLITNRKPFYNNKNYVFFPFLFNISYYTLQIFIQRVNFYRIYSVFMKACDPINSNRPSFLKPADFEHSEAAWLKIAYSIHNTLTQIYNIVPKIKSDLIHSQNTIFLIFQAATASLPYLFHKDKKVREMMIKDLVNVIPILEDIRELVSWSLIDASYFVLKELLPDARKLVSYCRLQINANDCEMTAMKHAKASFISLDVKKNFVPPFLPPVINAKLDEKGADTRLGVNEHLKPNEYIYWINTPVQSNSSAVKFPPIPRIIVKSYKSNENVSSVNNNNNNNNNSFYSSVDALALDDLSFDMKEDEFDVELGGAKKTLSSYTNDSLFKTPSVSPPSNE